VNKFGSDDSAGTIGGEKRGREESEFGFAIYYYRVMIWS